MTKSHNYCYGYIAYQTDYLKSHYPAEYFSTLLTSVKTNLDKEAVYLAECRNVGIEVAVPDINRSASDFTPVIGEASAIVFGLSAVRNVGEGLVELILAEREKNGPFADFFDFCERVDSNVLNKRTVESLIKAGAFDSLGHPRQGLVAVYEEIVDHTVQRRREHDMGVMSLFGDLREGPSFDERPEIPDIDFDKDHRLAFEKEMLGLYVSDHPLMGAESALRRRSDCTVLELSEREDGANVVVSGMVTNLQRKWTKKGDLMAVFQLEDLQSTVEVMMFPRTFSEQGHKLDEDVIVVLAARVDARDELPKLIARDVEVFEPLNERKPPLRLQLPTTRVNDDLVAELKGLIRQFPGESEVFIHLDDRRVLCLPDDCCVDTASGLVAELRVLLGADAVVL